MTRPGEAGIRPRMSDPSRDLAEFNRLVDELEANRDVRDGLPVTSHRPWLGPALVRSKQAFRLAFQPFINELFSRQAVFNDRLVESLQVVQRQFERVEQALSNVDRRIDERLAPLGLALPTAAANEALAARRGRVLTRVPVELLFTEGPRSAPLERWTPAWQEHHDRWADIPLARLLPHLELFEFFEGRGSPDRYLAWYEAIHATRGVEPPLSSEALLTRRHQDFVTMDRAFGRGLEGYRENPITADFNQRGYFNIRNGHHRAAFLFTRGWRHLPVEITTEDFAYWRGLGEERVRAHLHAGGAQRLVYTPLLLPGLLDYPAERDGYAPSRLDLILRSLGTRRLRGLSVLDVGCNVGFYAQHFTREGARVTGVEIDPAHVTLGRLLNEAHHVSYELRCEAFESAALEPHDLGLMLTVLYHYAKDEPRREAMLRQLDRTVRHWLFWESGAEPELEKRWVLEGTHFDAYRKLGETCGTGKRRELGVFFVGGNPPDLP